MGVKGFCNGRITNPPYGPRQGREGGFATGAGGLDNKPTIWLIHVMRRIGIFEAKTKFTALCEEVVRTGEATMVSKRGKPMVLVTPVPPSLASPREDIVSACRRWERDRGAGEGDFPEVWELRGEPKPDPLSDE
jgi:antitoxin (DNA-binding transcriptional repressor) of toxin-antitoxin stability system